MRSITSSWYRAHTELILRHYLHVLKMHDLYRLMTFKFYYKFKNNLVPNYFKTLFREKSRGSQLYPIKNPQYQLSIFKHEYARITLRCELIKQ